jgi:DNA primase
LEEHESLRPLSASQREALEEAVASYEVALSNDVEVVEYLVGRGIDQQTAVTFRLGVVPDPAPGHERFRDWLAIPYLNKDDQPLTVRFRCLYDHDHSSYYHGKYMSISGDPSRVFNVGAIHRANDEIHVTEGEMDALILNQLDLPAVAIPGASGFQGHHRRMLAGFNRVFVWGDPDEAGAEFTNKVCRMLGSAKGVRLRSGDVSENYLAGGEDQILSLIDR